MVGNKGSFLSFWVSRLLEKGITAQNIQEFSVMFLTNLCHYIVIPDSEFHKIHKKPNHLCSHISSLNIKQDYDLLKLYAMVSKVKKRPV